MNILHTSDWHLGKTLEGNSRLEEQKNFIEELISICNTEEIDLILICGDVFDTMNPPASAEKLFYKSIKELSLNGTRPIVAIAGNHDNNERLIASSPLALELGIILIGSYGTVINSDFCGTNCEIIQSGEGYIKLKIKNNVIVLLNMPYVSESRLNKIIFSDKSEKESQKKYSKKIKELFNNNEHYFETNTINIALGHFYISGGTETTSERDISIGGIYAVSKEDLPKAQYIAMGHLHRGQKIKNNIHYCGSPIQYSKSEANQDKFVYVVKIEANLAPEIKKIKLTNYKPIEVWKTESIEEAIERCNNNSDKECWVYLEIKTDRPLEQSEIKEIHSIKKDIVTIDTILKLHTSETDEIQNNIENKNPWDEFKEFYYERYKIEPHEKYVQAFKELWEENLEEGE